MLQREIGLLTQTLNIPKRTRKAPFNQWAWGSNPHGRTKTATFFGVSQFFVVSTSKTGHKWGFEKRGPPPIRRAKNAVARHFLARGRGPPRAHQKEPCRMLLKSTLQGSFSYAIFRFSVSCGLKLENRFTFCCCVRWTYFCVMAGLHDGCLSKSYQR